MKFMNYSTLLFIFLLSGLSSCSRSITLESALTDEKIQAIKVKRSAIKKIKFDSSGYCVPDKSEEVISLELEKLKLKLLAWDSKKQMDKIQLKSVFKETIMNLNAFAKIDNHHIQTDEREWIWSEMEKLGQLLNFPEIEEYFDKWREW